MTAEGAGKVLVVAASRHGSTAGLADELARALPGGVHREPGAAGDPASFAAVVVGSAVYGGRWLEPAREWVAEHAEALRARPVWLFSSGPIGAPPFPPDLPYDVDALVHLVRARGHRVLPGRLDPDRLSFGERAMATAMRAPVGDFRDWAGLRAWAAEIAGELNRPPAAR